MGTLTQLGANLFVYHGAIQAGIVRQGRRALLIDLGAGGVRDALSELGIEQVERILFTHHHRDQASGVGPLAASGTQVIVPAAEKEWFARVEGYWGDPASRWHLYDSRPQLVLAQSIPVHGTVQGGDVIEWGGATISVLDTPGHTDGSVSYQVDVKEGRYLFCGDVLYGEGQIWDLYSLQKGWETRDYHGFMGDRGRLISSLQALRSANARALIPAHGPIVTEPARAIDLLCDRLAACYDRYVAISALRYYFPAMFAGYQVPSGLGSGAGVRWRPDLMPVREGRPYPAFLRHVGTSWIVSSADGAAFVVDCGSEEVVRAIQGMQAEGTLGTVEWLWITHYHDDHVDAIPQFRAAFGCPIVADESVAQVVERPLAWRLPCISPVAVPVDRHTRHAESWPWHGFTVTAYHLPGQTLYHGGLLLEGRGTRVLFAGDSFTMAGIDDYCPGNRNFLGREAGFDASVALVETLKPDVVLNCHVDAAFDFSGPECAFMRANLAERERLYGELLPWDHPNYGLDESWVRCFPYEQEVAPGERVQLEVVLTNHSGEEREAVCRPVLPESWPVDLAARGAMIPSKAERGVGFTFTVPAGASPGRWVVPVEVTYGGRPLGQFREAILVVSKGEGE
jgi:glyoxylase-like metal-dependent hydrolase (beta-lactamase superfamily II)